MFDQALVKSVINSELTYKQLTNITSLTVGEFQTHIFAL
jgi:hypothetical protein